MQATSVKEKEKFYSESDSRARQIPSHLVGGKSYMFKKLDKRIDALNDKRAYLNADWDPSGNKALLEFYVKIMPKVLNAERCSIFIRDPATREIWLKAGTGLAEREIRVGESDDSVVGEVVTTGEHRIISGLEERNGVHKEIDRKTGFVTRDILSIPIKSLDGNEVMGAVQVLNKTDGSSFTDDDRKLLEEMAHYLELYIENLFFNAEATGLLRSISSALSTGIAVALWIVGLTFVLVAGRVLWVGLRYAVS